MSLTSGLNGNGNQLNQESNNISDSTWFSFLEHNFPAEDEEDDPDFLPEFDLMGGDGSGPLPDAWNQALQQHLGNTPTEGAVSANTPRLGGDAFGGSGVYQSPRLRESPRRAAKQQQQQQQMTLTRAMSPISDMFGNVRDSNSGPFNQSNNLNSGSGSLNYGTLIPGKDTSLQYQSTSNQNSVNLYTNQAPATNQSGENSQPSSKGKAKASSPLFPPAPNVEGGASQKRPKKSKKNASDLEAKKEANKAAAKAYRDSKKKERIQAKVEKAVQEAIARGEDPNQAATAAATIRPRGRPPTKGTKSSTSRSRRKRKASDEEEEYHPNKESREESRRSQKRRETSLSLSKSAKKARTFTTEDEHQMTPKASGSKTIGASQRDQTPISTANLNAQEVQELISLRAENRLLSAENYRLRRENEEMRVEARVNGSGKGRTGFRDRSRAGDDYGARRRSGEGGGRKRGREEERDRDDRGGGKGLSRSEGDFRASGSSKQRKGKTSNRRREPSVEDYGSRDGQSEDQRSRRDASTQPRRRIHSPSKDHGQDFSDDSDRSQSDRSNSDESDRSDRSDEDLDEGPQSESGSEEEMENQERGERSAGRRTRRVESPLESRHARNHQISRGKGGTS